ncbi:MAG: tRNA (guanine(10)-N(2))-dimethyltransferase [Candidatus Micrarchaeia archaeon]
MAQICEGKANINLSDGVFFNPKMKGLRDLSVAYVKSTSIGENSLLDSTSATGVRGIRYYLESGIKNITFLEINRRAYLNTVHNTNLNGLECIILNKSIQEFANSHDGAFDFIDLDPFGSAAPYVFDLMKISKDKTSLMVTGTDTAVLCGAHSSACLKEYFVNPIHNELCHEFGLRILACFIARNAAQFNFGINIDIAIANMHYMRIFAKLRKGAKEALESVKKCGYLLHCNNCRNFKVVNAESIDGRKCDYCGGDMNLYGPIWLGSLSNKETIKKIIEDYNQEYDTEMLSMLKKIYEEQDTPFFFSLPKITKYMHIGSISRRSVIEKLAARGFSVSASHTDKDSLKGNFSIGDVVEAIKEASKASKIKGL